MKLKACFFSFLFIPLIAVAQYDQKISVNLSAGAFKTVGYKFGEYEPMQMPNYGMGFAASGGVQFRISERFSLVAEAGVMVSHSWSYSEGDNNDFLYWAITDTVTGEDIAEGYNYLDILNIRFGIKPIWYLVGEKNWRPFLYLGVNITITDAYYEDLLWAELDKLDMLPPDDEGPYNGYLERNVGLGLNPGLGLEYSPGGRMHYYLTAGYSFIDLKAENFKSASLEENFHAVDVQAGIRFNFLKSRDL
jgi:hypothetical protein